MSRFASLPTEELEDVPVPFGEWLPDVPELNNPGALEALNVVPTPGGYKPFRQLDASNTLVLDDMVRGGLLYYDRTGGLSIVAGTTTGLYQRDGNVFTQRLAQAIGEQELWQFIQSNWDIVVLPPGDVPLVASVGGDLTFSPLGGSPPIAYCGAMIDEFLFLGNLDNEPDTSRQPSRIRWSAKGDITAPWVSDPELQSDYNDMPTEGGVVKALTGREFGTVFQERLISRITYTGDEAIFDIRKVEAGRGAIATSAVVDLGSLVFFIADDGFFAWNGTNSVPIADRKTNNYFFSRLNFQMKHLIVGGLDPLNKCVFWAFPVGSSSLLTEVMIYSLKEDKLTHAMIGVDYMMNAATLGITLEQITGPLESVSPPLDSPFYKGGVPALAGFTDDHKYGLFVGAPMEATIDTGLYSAPNRGRVFVNSVLPVVDTTDNSVFVSVMTKDQILGEDYVLSDYVGQEITGECPLIAEGRYMRFRVNIPEGKEWTYAQGVSITRRSIGKV